MKRTIPLLIASVTGFVMIASWFIPAAASWGDVALQWFNILAAVAFLLGGLNLLWMHLRKVSDKRAGWGYSAVTVFALLTTLLVGGLKLGVEPREKFPDASWSGNYVAEGSGLWWIFNFVIAPITATMFAMLAFYVASAAFRAFRAKNLEAILLLGTATIVLMGKTAVSKWVTGRIPEQIEVDGVMQANPWAAFRLERVTEMIMDVFNTAGGRAIMIGVALGVVSTSLKVILGVDRSYIGSDRE